MVIKNRSAQQRKANGIIKNISLVLLIGGYFAAGINHFRVPEFYTSIIPAYIPYPPFINMMAGIFEIVFAVALAFKSTRALAAWGVILMLAAFLPVHIDMVIKAPLHLNTITVNVLTAWLRLALQPVLMIWAWWHSRP